MPKANHKTRFAAPVGVSLAPLALAGFLMTTSSPVHSAPAETSPVKNAQATAAPNAAAATAAAPIPEPRLGLFASREDIAIARQRAETLPWAKEYKAGVLKIADGWLARPDAWIRDIMPPPNSKFAYGKAGCPNCNKKWGDFGKGLADFDRPLEITCPHCKTSFDFKNPSGPYADTGDGVMVKGRRFWLRAIWNTFVVNEMWSAFSPENGALVNLAEAYALTGDERYARKAVVMMDALATLAPQTNGPRDFNVDPNADTGRFHHLTSIMFRAQVHFARALDLLGHYPALQETSATNPGKTVWENIKYGIFEEYLFVPINTRDGRLHTLHNHEADSVRALVLVGILYGNPDYLRWGAQGTLAFLDNVIDRDGLYYETSLSYTEFTRSVFVDMAEMLVRYDPSKYTPEQKMPRREELPLNGNYFNHQNFLRLVLDTPERVSLLGRQPTFGNNHFDTSAWKQPGRPFSRSEFQQALRVLMYTTDATRRVQAANKTLAMLPYSGQKPLGGWWSVYRAPDEAVIRGLATKPAPPAIAEPANSDFFGQTGLAFLRSGQDENRRGAVLRAGMNMPHSHDDQLGLLLFAQGRALSGDIGYGIFGNHVHLGWATRAIAHHTVVVNQDETSNDKLFRLGPGGTIHRFYQGGGLSLTEASLTPMFPASDGVRDYRRTVMQVDLSPTASYWVDLFDVDGGRVHDYSMHMRPLGENGTFSFDGVTPQPVPNTWTLAALDPKHRDASFDEPGRAWGERLTVNGLIAKLPGVEDEVPESGQWYATPGNGYGFLHDVKQQPVAQPWSATWRWKDNEDAYGLRMHMLPETQQQVISAQGPTLTGTAKMQFVIARNGQPDNTSSIRTRYAAVLEGFGAEPQVSGVQAIRDNERVVGMRVQSAANGREDVILDARKGAVNAPGVPALDAGLGVIRKQNNQLSELVLTGGAALSTEGFGLRFQAPRWDAKITAVNDAEGTFRLSKTLPASAQGTLLTVNNPLYEHGSAYRIGSISGNGDIAPLNAGLTLASSQVKTPGENGFTASAPLVFGFEYKTDTRFLNGKRIVSGGKTGRVTGMKDFTEVATTGLQAKAGEQFTVYDLQPGDDVSLEATASLVREEDGSWVLRSNLPVTVSFPWAVERAVGDKWQREKGNSVAVSAENLASGAVRFRKAS